jgi:PIN domain nuclease of toxin-antitoxin system
VRLLLDTNVAIWSVIDTDRLSTREQSIIIEADEVYVSHCSLWELAIKSTQGRRAVPPLTAPAARDLFEQSDFKLLEIKLDHIYAVADLPALHKDPFDRLIVAQALTEPLRLVTKDRQLAAYSDTVIAW